MARQIHTGTWQQGLALALLGTALWGLTPAATKMSLQAADPDTVAFARLAIATAVFRALRALPLRVVLANRWTWVAGMALAADFLLYSRGLEHTKASAAAVLVCVEPVATIALAVYLLREPWNVHRALGSVFTLSGVVVAGLHGVADSDATGHSTLRGNILVVTAAILWSIYAVAQRKTLVDHDWASRLHAIFFVASLGTLPFALAEPRLNWHAPAHAWMWLGVLVLLCTAGVYIVYARAQRLLDVSVLSLLLAGIPVLSLIFASLLLQEPVTAPLVVAGLLVFSGAIVLASEPFPGAARSIKQEVTQSH
ncbi:MAG: DMT family transporter [Candidatus Binatia bacterium]|nr:DMT family transporter [Candidatus Binatia bacterium]